MRTLWLVTLACLVSAAPARAQNDKVRRGPTPAWVVPAELLPVPEAPSGSVFVRSSDSQVHLDRRGQEHYQAYRIKILHPNALQLGNLSIAWNPAAGAPTVHAIRVYRDGQVRDILKDGSFEVLRREQQLEAAMLDGLLTAVLRVPDLRVGDELEVSLTTTAVDPTLGPDSAGLLLLPPEPMPGRHLLGLSWEQGQKPNLKLTPEMAAAANEGANGLRLSFDNPAARPAPQGAPARYGWQRVVEYSDFADWPSVSRRFAPLYAKAARLDASSPLKEEARRIAAAASDPLARASAALRLVQQEVRYVYVGLDGGNLAPASPADTWQRRYGDCKGKTALLLALLAELGISAEPVLASNNGADDGLDQHLPNPVFFDHVLVRAHIEGRDYWLDGTLPPVAVPSLVPLVPYRWVLPLTASGSAIVRQQWQPSATPNEMAFDEIYSRGGFDRPARVTTTQITRGIEGLKQQLQFAALTPAQLLNGFRQESAGNSWNTIDDVRWRYDVKTQASVLTIVGTQNVEWEDEGSGVKSLILPGGGFNPPERRGRSGDQDQSLPYVNTPGFTCHVTTVRLPTATDPKRWSFNSVFDTRIFGRRYYRGFDRRDGMIMMIRGSRIEQLEVDAASAARDNARIAAFDNSMAVIEYDPAGAPFMGSKARVPATFEMDWTGENLPCLPSRN